LGIIQADAEFHQLQLIPLALTIASWVVPIAEDPKDFLNQSNAKVVLTNPHNRLSRVLFFRIVLALKAQPLD
jgi:hypothetical protein